MALLPAETEQIIRHFRRSELDTGSSEVQIALLTFRILRLTEHFKTRKNDHHSQIGLLRLVNRRRKLLDYLKSTKPEKYQSLINELDIRK
jgi:small subunit ribosomal protein S15